MFRSLMKHLLIGVKDSAKPILSWMPVEWRRGSVYKRWRKFLSEAQFYPIERIREWQLNNVRDIVDYAYRRTRGYKQLYDEAGVHPRDIRKLTDLQFLPFTTKELMRDNLEAFSVALPLRFYTTTGGSTGIPFGFYYLYENQEIEDAFVHTGWSWVGWKLDGLNAILRGAYIGSDDDIFKYDRFRNELLLSSYFLTEQNLPKYIRLLEEFNPRVIQAYPSSFNILCDLLNQANAEEKISADLVLLASENIYDWMMEKYTTTFPNTKFFSFYGHAELTIQAPWCEHNRSYHLWPFYGFTELLNGNSEEVTEGEEGELVGTSFHMRATPFIRYKTMDRAVKGPSQCPDCGRAFQLLNKISGRMQEVIVTGTGRYISMTAINMHSDIFDHVRQFQFYQDTPGKITFKIAPQSNYSETDSERIRKELMKKLGNDVELEISLVQDIPKTRSGKFRFLDQQLDIKYGE